MKREALSTDKEQALTVLERMPNDCTIEDIQYELYVIEKVRRGLASIDRGEGIPHEQAKKRLGKCENRCQ